MREHTNLIYTLVGYIKYNYKRRIRFRMVEQQLTFLILIRLFTENNRDAISNVKISLILSYIRKIRTPAVTLTLPPPREDKKWCKRLKTYFKMMQMSILEHRRLPC